MLANSGVKTQISVGGWSLLIVVSMTLFLWPSRPPQAQPPSGASKNIPKTSKEVRHSTAEPESKDSISDNTRRSATGQRPDDASDKKSSVTTGQIRKALLDSAAKLVDLKITVVEKGNFNERTPEMPVPVVFKEMWMHHSSMQVRMDWRNDGNGDEWWKGFKSTKGPLSTAHLDSPTELEECVDTSRELLFADSRPLSPGPNGERRSLHSVSKSPKVINNLFVPLFEFNKPWIAHRLNGSPVVDTIARLPLSAWHLLGDDKLGNEDVIRAEIDMNQTFEIPLKQHEGKLKITQVYLGWFSKRFGLMPLRIEQSMRYGYQGRDYRFKPRPDGLASLVYEAFDFRKYGDIWVPFGGNQSVYRSSGEASDGFSPDALVEKMLDDALEFSGELKLGYGYEWRILNVEPIEPSVDLWFEPQDGAEVFNMDTHKRYIQGDPVASAQFSAREDAIEALVGKPAPAFPDGATWLNGKPITWKALQGKVVILNFWADWCGSCHNDLPQLAELHNDRSTNGLAIIGVHVSGSEMPAVQKLIDEFELKYPICIDVANEPKKNATDEGVAFPCQLTSAFAINAIPHFVVVDQRGIVAASYTNRFEDALAIAQELVNATD